MQYFVYILRCTDNSLYTGITTDLVRRVKEHNGLNSLGSKYTAPRRPVKLVYSSIFENRALATSRELVIKKLTKKQKELLILDSIK